MQTGPNTTIMQGLRTEGFRREKIEFLTTFPYQATFKHVSVSHDRNILL